MFTAYVVTRVLAATNTFAATLDFTRDKQILLNMAKVGVTDSSITKLGNTGELVSIPMRQAGGALVVPSH